MIGSWICLSVFGNRSLAVDSISTFMIIFLVTDATISRCAPATRSCVRLFPHMNTHTLRTFSASILVASNVGSLGLQFCRGAFVRVDALRVRDRIQ